MDVISASVSDNKESMDALSESLNEDALKRLEAMEESTETLSCNLDSVIGVVKEIVADESLSASLPEVRAGSTQN